MQCYVSTHAKVTLKRRYYALHSSVGTTFSCNMLLALHNIDLPEMKINEDKCDNVVIGVWMPMWLGTL